MACGARLRRQPALRAAPGGEAAGEAGGEQVAAGGRLPVEHLAGDEHARMRTQHQLRIHRIEAYPAGAADCLVERAGAEQGQRQRLDAGREPRRVVEVGVRQAFRAAARP